MQQEIKKKIPQQIKWTARTKTLDFPLTSTHCGTLMPTFIFMNTHVHTHTHMNTHICAQYINIHTQALLKK